MPVLQFKGKTAIECYHHTVPHHTLEFDGKLSVLGKGEKPGLKKVLSTSTMHECEPRCALGARPQFVLFYAKVTSAGFPNPVTTLIPHHRPDCLSPAGPFVPMVGWTDSTERVR